MIILSEHEYYIYAFVGIVKRLVMRQRSETKNE